MRRNSMRNWRKALSPTLGQRSAALALRVAANEHRKELSAVPSSLPPAHRPLPTSHSSGVVLICVLACLAIATALVASAVQSALQARSDVRQQRLLRQTVLLVDAGMARAVRQLAEDADYEGETWELAPGVCDRDAARVEIEVVRNSDTAVVNVVARLPADGETGIQRSESFKINLPESSNQESIDENSSDES